MKKTFIRAFIVGIVLGAAIAVWGIISFKGNAVKQSAELYLSKRADYTTLLDSLRPKIGHHLAFDLYAKHLNLEQTYKAGHYIIDEGMNVIEIVRMIKLGMQTPINVTFNNAKTPAQLAGKLARQIDADSAEIAAVLTDQAVAEKYGYKNPLTMFSMFIPNTYELYWTVSPEQIIERMEKESEAFWADRDAKRKRNGLSRLEVMTLASIVYEETRATDEMATVAGVYINRLKKGMPLQADPTVKYAVGDFTLRRILHKHLRVDSPYNTYKNKGLPPSPICMPSIAAIDGVLNFEQHNYLYFCARPTFDGHHNFAATYSEHLRNARAYTKELNKRKIYK